MKDETANNGTTAKDHKTIWVFTPSRTDPKDLEFILVQRHKLLEDAVERVRESALTDHKHHLLFVGPRGCGKTHLVTLIISRLSEDDRLTDRLRIAWLNEDETCTTLLELLVKIHAALEKRYPNEFSENQLGAAYELKPEDALAFISRYLLSALGSHTLLVVAENLDAIFDGLGNGGQKQLRAFIQENPRLTIVATAQRLVEDLSDRASPFFGFFQTEHLKPLNVTEATELLQNLARLKKRHGVVEFLSTSRGRARVRALHHLSGGNHRIYIVLSEFITRDSIDALLEPFFEMVDELTPYYQERLRWLPPLQRKIVEYLCSCEGTVPVKEIAKRLFATPQTISSQLQDLREKGYVEANQRGRESLYEISEPLMRICVEVKENQSHQPLRLLVDFLRVWYDDQELKHRLGTMEPSSVSCAYLECALLRNTAEGNLRQQIFLDELRVSLSEKMEPAKRDGLLRELVNQPEAITLSIKSWHEDNKTEALKCLSEALAEECSPSSKADLLLTRADLQIASGQPQSAIEDYTTVLGLARAPVDRVAQALFNRAATYGNVGDRQREIEDYSAVIGLAGAPVDRVGHALFNRAVTYGSVSDRQREIEDYTALIELRGAPVEQVAKAFLNRGVAHGRVGNLKREIEDYTALIELRGAPAEQVAKASLNRGITYATAGETQRAIEDYSAVIDLLDAPAHQISKALLNRGIAYGIAGDTQREIEDYTAAIGLPSAPAAQIANALVNRGVAYGIAGNTRQEIEDYTAVTGLPGAPVADVARAFFFRGITYAIARETQRAIEDYTAVLGLADAPVEYVAKALFNRGVTYGKVEDVQREIEDYTALITLPRAPVEQVGKALFNRGVTYGLAGGTQREIEDYTTLIELPGASVEQVGKALFNRGVAHGKAGNPHREIEDYTSVVELPGAPVEQVAKALLNRGICYGRVGNTQREIENYTAVIGLAGAPIDQVAKAFVNRGITYGETDDTQREIEDYSAAIELPGAPTKQVARALYCRGLTFLQRSRKGEAQSDFETLIRIPDAPLKILVDSYIALSKLHFGEGRWAEGFEALEMAVESGAKAQPSYHESATDVVGLIFFAGLSAEGRREKVTTLLGLYNKYKALPVLGEAIVKQIGRLFRTGERFPSADNLEGWASAWEKAAESVAEFRLSVRLLRAGVNFLKAGGKDPGTLLDLTAPERSILEQAFGLAEKEEPKSA